MKPKDSDTFIDIGVSITRLLLIASGQGTAASLIGEGAGLVKNLRSLLGSGGQRAVSAEKIADYVFNVFNRLPGEYQGISEADWQVAAANVAPLIDRLSEKDRLAAGYDWKALRPVLRDLGSEERRCTLADESARQAFDWVLEVACQHITDCFTKEEALASILRGINETKSGVRQLLDRPAGASKTQDVVNDHIKVLRDLAPDRLEDRESEMADLKAFVHSSDDVWYAMEADMVSGKTAVMVSFALNSPDDVHMVSFFIRRIGGDGNDRGSFAFVMSAQLAKILGHEYTEPVRDPAQHTEFRQMLRRAATACRSEATPRTLVLLIDGIDEDSYFENPDGADAKSILSLLPRRLPEGVKIITASRPNPRLPEDVLCDANTNRRIVSLKPSPIAEKSINRKDMAKFFKSDVAVDIGAFLAACGGVLTVEDLSRLLTTHRHQRTRTWDVREYVDRSPGRILTPVDVGFGGQEVLAYRLGHDVVERAVILELDPNSFGEGDEPEDERWWAPIREQALTSYREIIRDWVKECASRGWGGSTPSYVLSGACFDLVFNDKTDDGSSVRVVLDRGRYDEMRRRSGRRSHVLRMIDRECFKTLLDVDRGELLEDAMVPLREIAEFKELLVRMSDYIPGLPELYVSYFNLTPEAALDMVLSVDDPESRLNALREVMETAIKFGYGHDFLPLLSATIMSLTSYRELHDEILRMLASVLASVNISSNYSNSNIDFESKIVLLNDILISLGMEKENISLPRYSLRKIDDPDESACMFNAINDMIEKIKDPRIRAEALAGVVDVLARADQISKSFNMAKRIEESRIRARALAGILTRVGEIDCARRVAEDAVSAAKQIEDPRKRTEALAGVASALVQVGEIDCARRVAEDAVSAAKQIEDPRKRTEALAGVASALVQVGEIDCARRVAEDAVSAAKQIEDPRKRTEALAGVAGVLAQVNQVDKALDMVKLIEDSRMRTWILVEVAGVLARTGQIDRARRVAEDAVSTAKRIEDSRMRTWILVEVAGVLARTGQIDRARRVAEDAVSTAKRIEDIQVHAKTLVKVAGIVAQADQINRARRIAEDSGARIENPRVRVDDLAEMAGALVQANQIEDPWVRAEVLAEATGVMARAGAIDEAREIVTMVDEPSSRSRAQSAVIKALVGKGSSDEAVNMLRAALAEVEELVRRQDAADCCATLAAACLDAADLVDAGTTTHEQWLGLARSALARSWLYGASVWDRFDVLLRVAPDLATRLVEERLLAESEPEAAGPASSVDPTDRADPDPEGPGGGAASSR